MNIGSWIARLQLGCEWLWNESIGSYCARDIKTGVFSNATTNASMLSFFAGAGSKEQMQSMSASLPSNSISLQLWDAKLGSPS